MSIKKILKKIIVSSIIFCVILWSVAIPFLNFIPSLEAAVTVNLEPMLIFPSLSGEEMVIGSNSIDVPAIAFDLSQNAGETLSSVSIALEDAGGDLTASDIFQLKVFQDEGNGNFDGTEPLCGSSTLITIGTSSPITINTVNNNSISTTSTTFFVTVSTGATWSDSAPDAVIFSMAADAIVTSINSPVITPFIGASPLVADTTGPQVVAVEYVNSNTVDVVFSEDVNMSADTMAYYTFNGSLNIIEALFERPNVIRLRSDGEIEVGTSTVTVSASVFDMADNANSTLSAQAVSMPIKVKISEISAEYNISDDEFVEIYNSSASTVDISGWEVQYSDPASINWTAIATVPALTLLSPYSFYLFGTASITPVVDSLITSGMALSGGHIRIYNGSQEVDKIGWGSATSPEDQAITAHIQGESFERKAFGETWANDMASGGIDELMGNGWDTENNSFDFVVQSAPAPQNSSSPPEEPAFNFFDNGGPMIMHMPINFAPTGYDLDVLAQMGDPVTPLDEISAKLYYLIGDGSPTDSVPLDYTMVIGVHQGNGVFKFTIPQAIIGSSTLNGLYYYLEADTNTGIGYMSANPEADMSGDVNMVAAAPFVVDCGAIGATYAISGNVQDETAAGIENVLVMLEGTGYSTTTDINGDYVINAPNGMYNIFMVKSGYYEEFIRDIFVNDAPVSAPTKTLFEGTGGGATGDSVKPIVLWTGPPDGMFGIPAGEENFDVFVGFSKDINSSTFNASSTYFTIDGVTPIYPSNIEFDNDPSDNESAFRPVEQYLGVISAPSGGFDADKTYYLILTGGIRDTSGNALEGNRPEGGHVISFTTGSDSFDWNDFGSGAMMPPFVIGTNPNNGALDINQNTKIVITFSDTMDSTSVTTAGNIELDKITVVNGIEQSTSVSITSSLDTSGKIAIVTPTSNLSAGKYRLLVSGALKNASGIWMGDPAQNQNVSSYTFYESTFDVGSNVDTQAPTILGTWPINNETEVAINPGALNIQFSESLNPATVNSNIVTLKRGTSLVTASVDYDPNSHSVSLVPSVVLANGVDYTLTITGSSTGIADLAGNSMASSENIIFTTSSSTDTSAPELMFANGDDFSIAITFSESMQAAKITDTNNWGSSVLNPQNYIIKYGDPATVASGGTQIDLSAVNAVFAYDAINNTVIIESLGLDPAILFSSGDVDFYVDIASSSVVGNGVADLSGNKAANLTNFQMPINNSINTMGILGPGDFVAPDMGEMGMMMAGAFPMNAMAGQTTIYFIDIPLTKSIPSGGKIVLTFPSGFDVSLAAKDAFSPINNDINEWNTGTVSISSVLGNQTNKTVTIVTAGDDTQESDYLHMDISGIVNSSIPRGPETTGYSIDIKTLDDSGNLLETISTMPIFINAGGDKSMTVTLNGVTSGDNGDVYVFLDSPMTGPIEKIATFSNSTSENVTFSSLPAGQYMIFTEPVSTLSLTDYTGQPMPSPIMVDDSSSTTVITLTKESAGAGKATITVNITGSFGTDDIDVFAGTPNDFKVKTISSAGDNPSAVFYLPDGVWRIGMGPAMPKNGFVGPPPMPDWMPPMPIEVRVENNGAVIKEASATADDGTIVFTINSANKQIIGYLKDDTDTAIADAEVWAYQPMGNDKGAYTKTDTNGKFILKVSEDGNYSVGAFKPGLPSMQEKSVEVRTNSAAADGNTTCDIYLGGTLITGSNLFEIKIKMPSYTISGKVTDGTNPVSHAPVWANRANGEGHADTMTDTSGNYVLYVDSGTWYIYSYIPGYGDAEMQTVVVSNSDETQNLAPDTSTNYYNISGTVTIDSQAQSYMPIRAVQYNSNGSYTGREYGASTDSNGDYSISVPGNALYRVDIWTENYGEVGLNTDEIVNNPANVSVVASDVSGKDITIASADLNTINFYFANAESGQEGFLNIEGMNYSGSIPTPNGYHKTVRISDLSASTTVSLADGDYVMFLDVPGIGSYIPDDSSNPDGRDATKEDIVISGDRWVDFTLPLTGVDMINVSGIVYESSVGAGNELADVWVWVDDPDSSYQNGVQSESDGSFSLSVPKGLVYKIGVDKPGYMSEEPSDLDASSDVSGLTPVLTPNQNTISGYIYYDTNSNGSYDSGEEIDGAFVRAETTNGSIQSHTPADGDGHYEVGVIDGIWRIYAVADGYEETEYSSYITISGLSANANIALDVDDDWENKSRQKPITPASGGSMDDTAQGGDGKSSGTGVKLTLPPNALGNSTASGNINANRTSAVVRTNSSNPIGGSGVNITASDNSGQAITNLNDYVDIEMVLYKADIEAEINAGNLSYETLKMTTNGYWDSTINDWVRLTTTRKAYYKNTGDTDWTFYNNAAATSSFEAFINTLPGSYSDYKLVFTSSVDHFTIFGTITASDSTPPSTPSGLTLTASNGSVSLDWSDNSEADLLEYQIFRSTSESFTCNDSSQINTSQVTGSAYSDSSLSSNQSYTYYYKITAVDTSGNVSTCSNAVLANYAYTAPTGGGSTITTTYCSDVVYYEWQSACINGWQYRNIMSKTPSTCTLTADQELQRKRECVDESEEVVDTDVIEEEIVDDDSSTIDDFEPLKTISEMKIVDKISLIISEAGDVFRANVNALLGKLGLRRDLAKEQNSVKKYVHNLLKEAKDFSKDNEYALTNFIAYGTETTLYLGEGERAGVINSYKSAFKKLPKTEDEWADAIKIANGRWPSNRNIEAEKNATEVFKTIYKRDPNRANQHDDAAITIISYGLRPFDRNLSSEKFAINVFRDVYGYSPKTAIAWDTVRAIAYSGAIR